MTLRTTCALVVVAALAIVFAEGGRAASPSRPRDGRFGDGRLEQASLPAAIDRRALVTRHNPFLTRLDPGSPLSVGNGSFAFTADITGLQTFSEAYEKSVPLGTLSDWGWHTAPNPDKWDIDRFAFTPFESHGRRVGYADIPSDQRTPEVQWLRANPHRLHLGRLAFDLRLADGRPASPADLSGTRQSLDLWAGEMTSRFVLEGDLVEVWTLCHPERDAVAVRVRSTLLRKGRLAIRLAFPYGTGAMTAADWSRPDAHETTMTREGRGAARFTRRLDGDRYEVNVRWEPAGTIGRRTEAHLAPLRQGRAASSSAPRDALPSARGGAAAHDYIVRPSGNADTFAVLVEFLPGQAPAAGRPPDQPPRRQLRERLSFAQVAAASRRHWMRFWQEGGAVDLSGSRDPRWRELERRIVLSQYLTAIQCAGTTPPQESGLTFNSWEGKFHLEMHWWHAAQFALWNRLELLDRSLDFYQRILPRARATAARQGYRGARWPKMTSPGGAESPSTVGPFLVWQQPHPIFYAELVYRAAPTARTLERFREVVFESAEFMASFAVPAEVQAPPAGRYGLGPPLHCAQEVFPKERTVNCTYELAYWRWGLEAAQEWRRRLGLPRERGWDEVLTRLAPLPVSGGKYLFAGSAADSYENVRWRRDHPSVVAALGVLPGPGVDRDTMRRTFDWIWEHWNWPDTWGWDYPMLAMTAARLGDPARAIDALLLDTPKNVYRANGHNYQRPGLEIYLPGNGGLLYAVAMMAAGWDGGPNRPAPGFPADGSWVVRYEGLKRAL